MKENKTALLCIMLLFCFCISGCAADAEKAQKAGFKTVEDYRDAEKLSLKSKEFYEFMERQKICDARVENLIKEIESVLRKESGLSVRFNGTREKFGEGVSTTLIYPEANEMKAKLMGRRALQIFAKHVRSNKDNYYNLNLNRCNFYTHVAITRTGVSGESQINRVGIASYDRHSDSISF